MICFMLKPLFERYASPNAKGIANPVWRANIATEVNAMPIIKSNVESYLSPLNKKNKDSIAKAKKGTSFINVFDSTKYIGLIATSNAPKKEYFGSVSMSLRSPYVHRTPVSPSVKVENLSAVNEKPEGRQKRAPQKT